MQQKKHFSFSLSTYNTKMLLVVLSALALCIVVLLWSSERIEEINKAFNNTHSQH
ncbi:MAG: hypothetical protein ACK4EY_10065 [Flavipsychrobacter sp.]